MNFSPRKHRGFSLMEMMVVGAIVGILFAAMPNLVSKVFRMFNSNRGRLEFQSDMRDVLVQVEKDIRQAKRTTMRISQDAGQPPYSKLTFIAVDGSTVVYRQEGRFLIVRRGARDRLQSRNLRMIQFFFSNPGEVPGISVTVMMDDPANKGTRAPLTAVTSNIKPMN